MHPVVQEYARRFFDRPEVALGVFMAPLSDHRHIMNVSWAELANILSKNPDEVEDLQDDFSSVYFYGWDRDERTKAVKELFKELVKTKEFNLDDYL